MSGVRRHGARAVPHATGLRGDIATRTAPRSRPPRPARRAPRHAVDLTHEPTLYVVAYAHLDTQWRWDYPTTIASTCRARCATTSRCSRSTRDYVFNFSGANRYRMMKEYYPADYETREAVRRRGPLVPVAARRWRRTTSTRRRPSRSSARSSTASSFFRARVRQDQRRVHAARLLRLPRVAAEHPRALRASRASRRRS